MMIKYHTQIYNFIHIVLQLCDNNFKRYKIFVKLSGKAYDYDCLHIKINQ